MKDLTDTPEWKAADKQTVKLEEILSDRSGLKILVLTELLGEVIGEGWEFHPVNAYKNEVPRRGIAGIKKNVGGQILKQHAIWFDDSIEAFILRVVDEVGVARKDSGK